MKKLFLLLSLFFVIFLVRDTHAVGSGGYENQVPAAAAMGMANSVVASVSDGSAIFFNPARLTSLLSTQVMLGASIQKFKTDFTSDAGESATTNNDTQYSPHLYVAHGSEDQKWGIGLGVNTPDGLATKWADDSPLRYISQESDLGVIDIAPAAALNVGSGFSVGLAGDYYVINNAESKSAVDVTGLNVGLGGALNPVSDGQQTLKADGSAVGATLGASWAGGKHMVGASYRTGANVTVDGTLKITGLSNESASLFGTDYETGVRTEVVIPPSFMGGYAYQVSEKLLLEGDVQWNKWSRFKEQRLDFSESDPNRRGVLDLSSPIDKQWRDSWSGGFGLEASPSEAWKLRAGYAFFDSPVPNSTFEASTPDSDTHMLALGVGWQRASLAIDFASQFYWLNDRHISNDVGAGTGNGKYSTTATYLGLSATWKFSTYSKT